MTKSLLSVLFLVSSLLVHAQGVPSSCSGPDSIVKKYRDDADRLAVRNTFKLNSTYTDSVKINQSLSNQYLNALIAVYNATSIPARDTVVAMLNLHTKTQPELVRFHVKAPGSLAWMDSLRNSKYPTGQISVDFLMNKYNLQNYGYYQSTNYDLVIFKADSNLNIKALCEEFKAIQNVIDASPEESYNDVKEIKDSLNLLYTDLTYTYGWGTCNNGCDYFSDWRFRVYNNCSVEYLGQSGPALYTNITEHLIEKRLIVFPVPAREEVFINSFQPTLIEISDLSGRLLMKRNLNSGTNKIQINELPAGIYFMREANKAAAPATKLIKN